MPESSELGAFVFCVTFILIFGALLSSMPTGLQGTGTDPANLIPVDPSLLSGFDEQENYTKTAYSAGVGLYYYDYSIGNKDWRAIYTDLTDLTFYVSQKWTVVPIVWIYYTFCEFHSSGGINRGTALTIDEIAEDAEDGSIRYDLFDSETGESQGAMLFYWNSTLYSDPEDAFDNDVLYQLHGIGFSSYAISDIGYLLVALLFLQLPNTPIIVSLLLAGFLWATIIYLLWFIITSTIPLIGP